MSTASQLEVLGEEAMLTCGLIYSELTKLCKPNIQQEDEGKYRCKQCKKLFKAAPFVEKHILNKHSELIGDRLEQVCNFEDSCPPLKLTLRVSAPSSNTLTITSLTRDTSHHL